MPRQSKPSTYDPAISSDEIREFKRLLRATPGASQNIWSARRTGDSAVEVRTGGPTAGTILLFTLTDRQWSFVEYGKWIT